MTEIVKHEDLFQKENEPKRIKAHVPKNRKLFKLVVSVYLSILVFSIFMALGYRPIIISGNSMNPKYENYDMILCKAYKNQELSVGTIAGYVPTDSKDFLGYSSGVILHRIVHILPNDEFILKGDNNPQNDPRNVKRNQIKIICD